MATLKTDKPKIIPVVLSSKMEPTIWASVAMANFKAKVNSSSIASQSNKLFIRMKVNGKKANLMVMAKKLLLIV